MDDVLKRLGLVEAAVAEMRVDLRHLATKADLKDEVGALRAHMCAMETRLVKAIGDMDTRSSAQIASLDGRILKWLVGTVLGSVGAAATVAKLLA